MAAIIVRGDWVVTNPEGMVNPNAQIYICTQPASTSNYPPSPLATLYTDSTGSKSLANPISPDQFGHAFAYMDTGTYTIVVTQNDIILVVLPDQDFNYTA